MRKEIEEWNYRGTTTEQLWETISANLKKRTKKELISMMYLFMSRENMEDYAESNNLQ